MLKRSLALSLGTGVELTYAEMVTLLAQISTSINSRPLGLQNSSETGQLDDLMTPLTPNQLLIGRSSSEPVRMEFDENDSYIRLGGLDGYRRCYRRSSHARGGEISGET